MQICINLSVLVHRFGSNLCNKPISIECMNQIKYSVFQSLVANDDHLRKPVGIQAVIKHSVIQFNKTKWRPPFPILPCINSSVWRCAEEGVNNSNNSNNGNNSSSSGSDGGRAPRRQAARRHFQNGVAFESLCWYYVSRFRCRFKEPPENHEKTIKKLGWKNSATLF